MEGKAERIHQSERYSAVLNDGFDNSCDILMPSVQRQWAPPEKEPQSLRFP